MPSIVFRCFVVCLVLLGAVAMARAGMNTETAYTERGQTDFDTFLQVLNPYGKWSKIEGKWAFTPDDHIAPYTDGRWLYTEYGWYWKGRAPHSWATEHYGYWKRSADKVWSWYPGPYWLPQIVEFRATTKYIGWRTGAVDSEGSFVEAPIDRYSKPEEWTFVTLAQFANPITPGIVAKPDVARDQLDDSTDCRHTYLTYREIDRPGPHPADFFDLSADGGMLAPKSMQDVAAAQAALPKPAATNSPAAKMTGVHLPVLIDAPTEVNPAADTRQVKYWVTMSLPTFWTPPPADAKSGEIYIYRPDTFQDGDGIARRITLWFNPKERSTLKDVLGNPAAALSKSTNAAAAPAPPKPRAHDPFRSPLDDTYHPGSSTAPAKAPDANAVSPGTNAAPVNPGLATPATR
jgi:hypothetical protein